MPFPDRRRLLSILAIAIVVLSTPSMVMAWGKAHGYISRTVAEKGLTGLDIALYAPVIEAQSYWADGHEPEDFKGTVGIDEEINPLPDLRLGGADPDHWLDIFNFDRGTPPSGEAQNDFALFIENARQAFLKGDKDTGVLLLGRGIHYLEDIGMPYHTVLWENLDFLHGHSSYESWADDQWTTLKLASWVQDGASFSQELVVSDPRNLVIELARISNRYLDRVKQGKWTSDTKATQELMFHVGQYVAAAFEYTAPSLFTFAKKGGTSPTTPPPAAGGCTMVHGPAGSPATFAILIPFLFFLALSRSRTRV